MEAFQHEISDHGGEWEDQSLNWNDNRIKKLVRTGNASALDDEIRKLKVNLNDSGSTHSRNNALHLACALDNLEKVVLLVRNGADVNHPGDGNATALHFCTRTRELQVRNRGNVPGDEIEKKARNTKRHDKYETVVQFLLEHNAEVNAKDSFGRTPLHMAALLDNEAIASELILRAGKELEIDATSNLGETPLHVACRAAHWSIADRLVENGASLSVKDSRGQNCFHKAAGALGGGRGGRGTDQAEAAAVRRLVEDWERIYLRDTDTLVSRDAEGRTPLDVAVSRGNTAVARVLMQAGAEVDGGSFIAACGVGRPDLVEMLLERGAEVNPTTNRAPLFAAAEKGDAKTIALLLDFGADVEVRDGLGRTPLLRAVAAVEPEAAKRLLEARANPLATDAAGRSGLMLAAKGGGGGDLIVARILLESAERDELLSLTDADGRNALHFAATDECADMAHLLIENGIGM